MFTHCAETLRSHPREDLTRPAIGELREQGRQLFALGIAEASDGLFHGIHTARTRPRNEGTTRLGEHNIRSSCIGGICFAGSQFFVNARLHEPTRAGLIHSDSLGDLAH